jgi:uncharacterized protein YecE (DUF72 family)
VTTPTVRVGVGGWVYEPWRNNFYPAGWPSIGDVFIYFINGAKEKAPAAAMALRKRLD